METWCAYVDGLVIEDDEQSMKQHLALCDSCFSTVATLRQARAEAESAAPGQATPEELLAQVQGRSPGQRSSPGLCRRPLQSG